MKANNNNVKTITGETARNAQKRYNTILNGGLNILKLSDLLEYNNEYKQFYDKYENFASKNQVSPNEANALRHIAGSMYFTSKYSPQIASALGNLNELNPLSAVFSEQGDSKIDLYNNHIGRQEGLKYSELTPEQALINGVNLIRNTDLAALNSQDSRALNFEYPATTKQKIIGNLLN